MGGVVGSIPANNQPSGIDSLAKGLMSGLSEGANVAQSMQATAHDKQKMQFEKDLQPSVLQEQQGKGVEAEAKGEQALLKLQADRKIAEAANLGFKEQLEIIRKNDLLLYSKINAEQSLANERQAKAAEHLATAGTKMVDYKYNISSTEGEMASQQIAAEQQQPGAGQKVLDMQLQNIPDGLRKQYNQKFDMGTALALVKNGQEAQITYLKQQEAKATKEVSPELRRATEFAKLENNPNRTPDEETIYRELKEERAANNQKNVVSGPLDTELGKQNAKVVSDASTKYADTQNIRNGLAETKRKLKDVPEYVMNPAMGWTGLQKLNPEFQKYNQTVQNTTLAIKDALYKLGGGQGFSNKDAERLEDIARGGIGAYKGTAEEAIDFLDRMLTASQGIEYVKMDKIMKQSSQYEQWKQSNPEPEVNIVLPNGTRGSVPATKLDQIIKDKKAQVY